jgi:phosphoribosylformimino-5-aminoimidazole carboxamide ribotide isomerase
MRIIPAIDLIDGKCVRLAQGDYNTKKIYNQDPLEVAKSFEGAGIQYLHLVDLDGAKAKHIVNYKTLEKIALHTSLSIDFGGGLKSNEDLKIAFENGANQITGGSIAVNNKTVFLEWLEVYGKSKIILGADVKGEKIATNGWTKTSDQSLFEFLEFYKIKGVQYVICTDISKDGMLQGPALNLYKQLISETGLSLIASGGVATMDDLSKLEQLGCEGTILGKAIYENQIALKDLEKFIINQSNE